MPLCDLQVLQNYSVAVMYSIWDLVLNFLQSVFFLWVGAVALLLVKLG